MLVVPIRFQTRVVCVRPRAPRYGTSRQYAHIKQGPGPAPKKKPTKSYANLKGNEPLQVPKGEMDLYKMAHLRSKKYLQPYRSEGGHYNVDRNARHPMFYARDPTDHNEKDISGVNVGKVDARDDFEVNWEGDMHFYRNGTKVPQKFDKWIENPGAIVTPRDKMLQKRSEKLAQKRAEQQRSKFFLMKSGEPKHDKTTTTRRMERVGLLVLEDLRNQLQALPSRMAAKATNRSFASSQMKQIFERSQIELTDLDITFDLKTCTVYWKCKPGYEEPVARELERGKRTLRHMMTSSVNLKSSPQLIFVQQNLRKGKPTEETAVLAEREMQEQVQRMQRRQAPGQEAELLVPDHSQVYAPHHEI